METAPPQGSHALDGAVIPTFYRYLIPSLVGMLAMTSSSLVDGIFIGNLVGVEALAAVNLLIPIMSLLFGVGLMLSVGGSVRGGKYLGEKNNAAASAIFSKTMIVVLSYGVLVVVAGLVLERQLFFAVGAPESLFPLMSDYYRVIMPALLFELVTIVLYFFVRQDGFPTLTAVALVFGAIINIALDYLFIARFGWGLSGAAWATAIAQLVPMLILCTYFFSRRRKLHFAFRQTNWLEVIRAAYNGLSEFINEISGGIIALIFNWMLIQRMGVEGVAALTVVNYLLMIGFMVFFAISDTAQVMISQNYGAKSVSRIQQFFAVSVVNALVVSLLCVAALLGFNELLISLFLAEDDSASTTALAQEFVHYVWPVFIFAGANMTVSGYLTAIHRAFQSGAIALSRSLVMPAGLLALFFVLFEDHRFVMALAIGEALTFILCIALYLRHQPGQAVAELTKQEEAAQPLSA